MSKKPVPQPQKSQSPNTSNVVSIEEMVQKQIKDANEKHITKLSEDNVGLSTTIDNLLKRLEEKENEIMHLQKMLSGQVPIIGDLSLSNEELIAEKQIANLKTASMQRDLTLDEAKRLDIYVKIKNMNKQKEGEGDSSLPRDVTPKQLLSIAAKRIE